MDAPNYVQGQYTVAQRDAIFAKAAKYPDASDGLQNQVPTIFPDGTVGWRQIPEGGDGTANANIAAIESTQYASRDYAVNDLLIYNDQLYRVTAPIAAGGAIIPDANVVSTTVAIWAPEALVPNLGKGDNLFDNAYFIGGGHTGYENTFPINQRGFADYTNYTGTAIDRWALAGGTLNLAAWYVTLRATNGGGAMFQRMEGHRLVNGATYTLSVLTADDLYSGQFVADNSGAYFGSVGIGNYFYGTGTYYPQLDLWEIAIARQWDGTGEKSVSIKAMKLELGNKQTLARQVNGAWVLNDPPPNYQQELAKCQRYLCRFGQYDRFQPIAGSTDALVTTPVPLRAGGVTIINPQNIGGNTWNSSSVIIHNAFTNQIRIRGANTVGPDVELTGDVYFSAEP